LIFRFIYIVIGYALAGVVFMPHKSKMKTCALNPSRHFLLRGSNHRVRQAVALFAFVVVQFQYFFGGTTNIHVDGYTYAEYARRGFGELVTVAFFALLMLLTLSAITKRDTETQRRVFSGLGVTLVALLLVMLVSAFKRLGLYEEVYGFSRLRTYTHVFLIWIGLLLIATIALRFAGAHVYFCNVDRFVWICNFTSHLMMHSS
jgi:FtsH-binding integral membrane protein